MTAILIFLAAIAGLNCIPLLISKDFPRRDRIITKVWIFTLVLFLIFTALAFNGYQLKGIYSSAIIGLAFVISCLLFFSLVKNTRKKVLSVILVTPLIALSLLMMIFGEVTGAYKIDAKYKIIVSTGGPLSCGESIKITRSELGLFEKVIHYETALCLLGVNKIETLEFNGEHAEFLIYHNGKMDTENPYHYEVKNSGMW